MLTRLQKFPSDKKLVLITSFSSFMAVIFVFLMRPVEIELKSKSVYGVLDLEFAWTVDQIETVFKAWGDELITKELGVTFLDFGFLIFYSLALSGITLLLTRRGTFGVLTNWGYLFTIIPVVAAFFDSIENINLVLMLISPSAIPFFAPFFASISAVIKFSLIIITILFWIIGFLYSFLGRIFVNKSNE